MHRLRIEVVENGLHHTAVNEQSLDLLAVPRPAFVSWLAVDAEHLTLDGDGGFSLWFL
jgi:hypothetical protein